MWLLTTSSHAISLHLLIKQNLALITCQSSVWVTKISNRDKMLSQTWKTYLQISRSLWSRSVLYPAVPTYPTQFSPWTPKTSESQGKCVKPLSGSLATFNFCHWWFPPGFSFFLLSYLQSDTYIPLQMASHQDLWRRDFSHNETHWWDSFTKFKIACWLERPLIYLLPCIWLTQMKVGCHIFKLKRCHGQTPKERWTI